MNSNQSVSACPIHNRTYQAIFFIVISLIISLIVFLNWGEDDSSAGLAPGFNLELVSGSDARLSLSELRGKAIALHFSDSECKTCEETQSLLNEFRNQGLEMVTIVTGDSSQDVREKLLAMNLKTPMAFGGVNMAASYQVSTLPLTVFINPEGFLHARIAGALTPAHLDKVFTGLL